MNPKRGDAWRWTYDRNLAWKLMPANERRKVVHSMFGDVSGAMLGKLGKDLGL